jgi:hypothetical protein
MRPLAAALVVTALAALGVVGCPKPPPPPPPPVAAPPAQPEVAVADTTKVLADDQRCTSDSECTLTTVDCCGCDSLGAQVGVRADKLAALVERRQPVCSAIHCAMQMSDDPSCAARKAVCKAGACVPETAK